MKTEKVNFKEVSTENKAKTLLRSLANFHHKNGERVLGFIIPYQTILSNDKPVTIYYFFFNQESSRFEVDKVKISPADMLSKHPNWIIIVNQDVPEETPRQIELDHLWKKLKINNPVTFA